MGEILVFNYTKIGFFQVISKRLYIRNNNTIHSGKDQLFRLLTDNCLFKVTSMGIQTVNKKLSRENRHAWEFYTNIFKGVKSILNAVGKPSSNFHLYEDLCVQVWTVVVKYKLLWIIIIYSAIPLSFCILNFRQIGRNSSGINLYNNKHTHTYRYT